MCNARVQLWNPWSLMNRIKVVGLGARQERADRVVELLVDAARLGAVAVVVFFAKSGWSGAT